MRDSRNHTVSVTAGLDSEFLGRLRRRDPIALEEVVNAHARPLFRAAGGMGLRREEAEDLVQNVFVTFLETLDRFKGHSQVRTWLFGILHHKVLERRRSFYRESQQDPIDEVIQSRFDTRGGWARPPADLQRLVESRELGQSIKDCMEKLPPLQREVFVLRDMEELESEEVCKILEITRTNMFVSTSRARNRLRECLEEKEMRRSG